MAMVVFACGWMEVVGEEIRLVGRWKVRESGVWGGAKGWASVDVCCC